MRSDFFLGLSPSGFHRMHYADWGDADNPRIVICVHGLTRTGRDFDDLARALAPAFRVICPDVVGRGRSDWLAAKEHYAYPQYLADMNALIARATARAGCDSLYWVGTSMGAIIGMLLASQPKTPLAKLVVNDVGGLIPKAAIERIGMNIGRTPRFPTLEALEAHVRHVSAPFGPLTDEQWRHLTLHAARQLDDGAWTTAYDPAIAIPFHERVASDVNLWECWDAIRCPTLLLRGSESDLLLKETAVAMMTRGPRARFVEFAGVGHAPMLMDDEQVGAVREFLLETP